MKFRLKKTLMRISNNKHSIHWFLIIVNVLTSTSIDPSCNVTGCATGYSISGDKKKCIVTKKC